MLQNMHPTESLGSLARRKSKIVDYQTVRTALQVELEAEGWIPVRQNKTTVRMQRAKAKSTLFEDRVWSLLFRMGYMQMSGKGGASLALNDDGSGSVANQLDVVAVDPETALAIECKCAERPKRRPNFQEDIAKLAMMRTRFVDAVRKQFPVDGYKRLNVFVIWTWDIIVSENDRERARNANVVLLDELDLEYYEHLVSHLGSAAKYQFCADVFPNKAVPGLEASVPALQAKMGEHTCYTFSIRPDYLLKIAYVSHRAKGKATDVDTYQRMIRKTRLKKIRKYIDENGIFPTNIVINLEGSRTVRFDKREDGGDQGARYGTLHLRPSYRSAWIIDGQHRLFAYSGSPRASTSFLSVLAFEGLPADQQAQLFIDINHEQKSVKRSLLQELYAELHWDSPDEASRAQAVVSKAIHALDEEGDSPFRGRVLLSDDTRTAIRCISLTALFRALNQPGMFIVKPGVAYGPLWGGENNETLSRLLTVVKAWFSAICDSGAADWWELGAADGGGLAMNDGVMICMAVLRSVFQHLEGRGLRLTTLTADELVSEIRPFADALGNYLGGLSSEERLRFRSGSRGVQGQTNGRRRCERALHDAIPEFEPAELKKHLELESAQTNEQAYAIIQAIERSLKSAVLDVLKAEFRGDSNLWWYEGIPEKVRLKVTQRIEADKGALGDREDNFDLLDYRAIIMANWALFKDMLGRDAPGRDRGTNWLERLNDLRRIVMHPSREALIDWDSLSQLEEYRDWLSGQLEDGS